MGRKSPANRPISTPKIDRKSFIKFKIRQKNTTHPGFLKLFSSFTCREGHVFRSSNRLEEPVTEPVLPCALWSL